MKLAVSLLARTKNIPAVFQDVENIFLSMIVIFFFCRALVIFSPFVIKLLLNLNLNL